MNLQRTDHSAGSNCAKWKTCMTHKIPIWDDDHTERKLYCLMTQFPFLCFPTEPDLLYYWVLLWYTLVFGSKMHLSVWYITSFSYQSRIYSQNPSFIPSWFIPSWSMPHLNIVCWFQGLDGYWGLPRFPPLPDRLVSIGRDPQSCEFPVHCYSGSGTRTTNFNRAARAVIPVCNFEDLSSFCHDQKSLKLVL